ncbi:Mobile element protein [Frigoriglobus tundricola]|uniref:Mobile element protein n=1 Tax=Frigoriglobus tundricola TaxID=2774151 RepID=A0A6M5Z3Y3_9BACT|nr:Mobile element protein [Frigoriglobus tundricola]
MIRCNGNTVGHAKSSGGHCASGMRSRCGTNCRRGSAGRVGGKTAAVLYSPAGTCKHLGIDPFAYLRAALPGLFALGEKPAAERLLDWLPGRWLLSRTRGRLPHETPAGLTSTRQLAPRLLRSSRVIPRCAAHRTAT